MDPGSPTLSPTVNNTNIISSISRGVLTQEDVAHIIGEFLDLHSKMQFDKIRVLMEGERQRLSTSVLSTPALQLWLTILNVFSQLSLSEASYYSLVFFTTKFSFRKENHIRDIYVQLRNDLQKCAIDGAQLSSTNDNNEDSIDNFFNFLIAVSTEFAQFSTVRIELIDFYMTLPGKDWNVAEVSQQKLSDIMSLCAAAKGPENIVALKKLKVENTYIKELTVLNQLFRIQQTIMDCNLIDSLILLKELRQTLNEWFSRFECITPLKSTPSFFLPFSKKARPTEKLALLNFLNQFYQTLFAKLSLYFHDIVAQFVPQNDLKIAFTSSNSFLHSFQNFYRKSSPQIICILVSRIDLCTPFYGFGYHRFVNKFSSECCKPTCGISEKYPPLFIYPQEKRIIDAFYVNIVTFVQEICLSNKQSVTSTSNSNMVMATAAAINTDNRPKYLCDKSKDQSFFAANIEANIYMAVAYDRKVQERESTVINFFNDTLNGLRLNKLFQDLRNFAKCS